MIVDALIVIVVATAIYKGRKTGFLLQLCSMGGFFLGLLVGAWLEPHLIHFVHGTEARAIFTVSIIFGSALLLLIIGEVIGLHLKHHVRKRRVNTLDNGLGSVIGAVSLLLSIWLMAAVINSSSSSLSSLQTQIRDSRIIGQLNRSLPSAPNVISRLNHLVDPNGFPDVFIGNEPVPRSNVNLPALGDLATAVNADRDSVVRIEGQGCGGVVSGSGFVVGNNLIATNAHVVAGIKRPYAQDVKGTHNTSVIWFDPGLDFALLRVSGTVGHPLELDTAIANNDTPAAVLGYPGGGNFNAGPAVALDQIKAAGRDIYGEDHTLRDVYEIQANIVPGNSGGPLVGKDGKVIGIVFAESTSYNHVGYALTTDKLGKTIKQADTANKVVGTGRCAE